MEGLEGWRDQCSKWTGYGCGCKWGVEEGVRANARGMGREHRLTVIQVVVALFRRW